MSVKRERICQLCLKLAINECNHIDETVKLMFQIVLLKFDLDIVRDLIVCQGCVEAARKCLDFKYTCVNTERVIFSSSIATKKAKLNINSICKEEEDTEVFDEDFNIQCRFCMTQLGRNHFVPLDILMNDTIFEILWGCLPEMDFNIIKNPTICSTCRDNLQHYLNFLRTCQDLSHFFVESNLECSDSYSQMCLIKQESITIGHTENVRSSGYSELMQVEELDIKDERSIFVVNTNEKLLESISDQHFPRYSNKKTDETVYIMCKCSTCTYEVNQNDGLKKYMLIHKDVPKMEVFKCSLCTYETKYKGTLKRHMLIHKDVSKIEVFKCSVCTYETIYKCTLKRHMLIHKDVPKIEAFKCSLCTYETNYKSTLKRHMLIHQDVPKLELFKCSLCTYETKHKGSLKRHMLIHKDVSEIKMFKCSLCTYETKHKVTLKRHMLVHKDISEINMFKCALCTYETKQRGHLKEHMLIRKSVSEIEMFKCSQCTYEAKQKSNLKTHMKLSHKDVSEINMFKCALCTYETKQKGNLKSHILIHRDVSEIYMFKCSLCPYEAKQKGHLKKHLIIHKDVSEIEMFKCALCTYEAKRKSQLKKHIMWCYLTHI